jgi:hypothetical protein
VERVTARYERTSDNHWRGTVDEVPEVDAAARALSSAMGRLRVQLSELGLGSCVELLEHVELAGGSDAAVRSALDARANAARAVSAAVEATRAAAVSLIDQGMSSRDIGALLKLSHTRVRQLLAEEVVPTSSSRWPVAQELTSGVPTK